MGAHHLLQLAIVKPLVLRAHESIMSRYDSHVRRAHPITFGLIILFSIIELGISAFLVSIFDSSRLNFLLFTSIWTLLFAPAFVGLFFRAPGHVASSVGAHWIFLI